MTHPWAPPGPPPIYCDGCVMRDAETTLASALMPGVSLNLCTLCVIQGAEPAALVRALPEEPITTATVYEAGRYIPAALYWKGHRP